VPADRLALAQANLGRQALLVLACLRKGETFAGLAAGSASAPRPPGGT
jgi:hypothetical protein